MPLTAVMSGQGPADLPPEDWEAMAELGRWAREFLCRPHPQLGRPGEVCPYTRPSIDAGLFRVAVCRPQADDPRAEITAAVRAARVFWEGMAPTTGSKVLFKTVLVLLPGLSEFLHQPVIDGVQRELSLEFTRDGLMVGEFYPSCPVTGLHNREFRPMQAPLPLIAIRRMVLGDLPFLWGSEVKIESYIRHFGATGRQVIDLYLDRPARLPPEVARRLFPYGRPNRTLPPQPAAK